jgi:PadR family transcriptional regulator, regulatory protein PadR
LPFVHLPNPPRLLIPGHFTNLAGDLFSKYKVNTNCMSRNYLGEFEELVLLTVAHMNGEAYGASITQDITRRTGRTVVLSAVHVALYRLEEKGLVSSEVGGATKERGGRRKRLFTVTAYGISILSEIRQVREELWQLIPKSLKPSSL